VAPVSDLTTTSDQRNRGLYVAVLFAIVTLGATAFVSPYALLTVLTDAVAALVVIGPACLMGFTLVPLLGLSILPARWHFLLGTALGIGCLSLLVLTLGLLGVLHRSGWIAILIAFTAVGALQLRALRLPQKSDAPALPYAWLVLIPFAVLALLATAHAPGFLWAEEGYGYDVLEYHLQMPKEYYELGRIAYAPHNVYANFPSNVEMLSLLAMVVHRDVYDIGTVAHMLHLTLGALAIYAAWVLGREWSAAAGVASAIGVGSAGWLVYLSGLAYVENGLLFFGMASLATLVRAMHPRTDGLRIRWLLVSGILAGFACGCKYTAVGLILIPSAIALLVVVAGSFGHRLRAVGCFVVGCVLSLSPWLAKNAIMTGNPVFPLCNSVFRAFPEGWGDVEQRRWDAGHSVPPDQRALTNRLRSLWRHIPGDANQRFGPAILILALVGLCMRRWDRTDAFLAVVLAVQLAVWLWATHLYARFAVPMLIPLAALVGRAISPSSSSKQRIVVGALAAGAAWNATFAIRMYMREGIGGAPASIFYEGKGPGYEYLGAINNELPGEARILLVGDARPFYIQRPVDYAVVFNDSPFAQSVETAQTTEQVMQWLRERGYSHIVIHWAEIERLRRTYAFSSRVTPGLFLDFGQAGLSLWRAFPHPAKGGRYVDLYEVTPLAKSQSVPNGP